MLAPKEKNIRSAAADTFSIYIRQNNESAVKLEYSVKPGTTFSKLKKLAAKELKLKNVKCVFLPNGNEVKFLDEIKQGDELLFSQGEPFYKNKTDNAKSQEKYCLSIIGAGGVGKSALTLRYVRDLFVGDWDPTIEDAYSKSSDVDGNLCQLEILDTAGQDEFESLRPHWMSEKDGYVFVYSVDSSKSLQELDTYFSLHQQMNVGKSLPIILVANKQDIIKRDPSKCQVPSSKGKAKASEMKATYIETSALTGENVHDIFETFIRECRQLRKRSHEPSGKCTVL